MYREPFGLNDSPVGVTLGTWPWLPGDTWLRFFVWLVLGLVIYVIYGYRNSRLRNDGRPGPRAPTSSSPA